MRLPRRALRADDGSGARRPCDRAGRGVSDSDRRRAGRGGRAVSADAPPLKLDASREEVIARAAEIVLAGWRSFDQARPSEPPLDDEIDRLLALPVPEGPTPVLDVLDEAAAILDRSIAQPRPRYFAFIGSSGLPIGVVGDMLAACF